MNFGNMTEDEVYELILAAFRELSGSRQCEIVKQLEQMTED